MRMGILALETVRLSSKSSIASVYQRYSSPLYRYAYRLLGDQQLAEECVADTFEKFLNNLRHRHEGIQNVQAYLYRMAHNWVSDYYRQIDHQPISLESDLQADPNGNPSKEVLEELERQQLRAALMRLPPDQRQVLLLRFVEEWSYEDVAQAMQKSLEATRALQHRALQNLRKMLRPNQEVK